MVQANNNNIIYINTPSLTVGVMSDLQLLPYGRRDVFYHNFVASLNTCKRYECDVVIVAGDITNLANNKAFSRYTEALEGVYGDNSPIMMTIMGNHDLYWIGSVHSRENRFARYTGNAPCMHYCINGYHFLTVSQSSSHMGHGYIGRLEWLRRHLDMAVAEGGDRPIVVVTHLNAVGTVYGSDGWGDYDLAEVLSSYPTVVNFGGHSHYSILDERSIHQGDYTSINTQSVSYVELEPGKVNGIVPPLANSQPMGLILQYGSDSVQMLRVNMHSSVEQKSNMRWSIPTSISREQFVYCDRQYSVPAISGSGSSEVVGGVTQLVFTAGQDSDFVHSYKVVLGDMEQYYFSDFYLGIDSMASTVILPLYNVPKGIYTAKIYAVNSGGNVSQEFIAIDNVVVSRKVRYREVLSQGLIFGRF